MLVTAQQTEEKLKEDIERARIEAPATKIFHFAFSTTNFPKRRIFETFLRCLAEYTNSYMAQVYLCNDRDIFFIMPGIMQRHFNEFITKFGKELGSSTIDAIAFSYEPGVHFYKLEALYKEKIRLLDIQEKEKRQKTKQNNIDKFSTEAGLTNVSELMQTLQARRYNRDHPIIMICDNDDMSRAMASNVLEKDYSIVHATNGRNVITKYIETAPDVVFLDILSMPDMNGYDILDYILQVDHMAYVIMFSCHKDKDKDSMMRAVEGGAKGFIKKPFTSQKLFEHVRQSPFVAEKKARRSTSAYSRHTIYQSQDF